MTEDKKIKIGKLCNKIATVLFVLFFIDTCVMPIMNKRFFITSVVIIAILFAICSITSHILLKDYKPESEQHSLHWLQLPELLSSSPY